MLQTANFTHARDHLKTYCDSVVDNNATLIITRKDDKNVVVQSLDSYNYTNQELNNLKKEMAIYKRLRQAEIEAETNDGTDATIVFDKAMAIIKGQENAV
jgi:antitoxin YefM